MNVCVGLKPLKQDVSKPLDNTVVLKVGLQAICSSKFDLLFIELMSQLSHIKQIYSEPIHLKHDIVYTRGSGVNLSLDSSASVPGSSCAL